MKIYTGMVKLSYRNDQGIPSERYVMAFYNTAKQLKQDFLPGIDLNKIKVTPCK